MPNNMVLLETIALTQSAASVTFDNLPTSGYTDLKIVASVRSTGSTGNYDPFLYRLNNSTSGYTAKDVGGNGASAGSGSNTTMTSTAAGGTWGRILDYGIDQSTSTASTFSSLEMYIPNYLSSNNKSLSVDHVMENNATSAWMEMAAGLWSNTASITSVSFALYYGSFAAGSTFSLYGIAAFGTTPVLAPKATGGNIVANDGTYWYHAFTSSGYFVPQVGLTADVLVIAGGGGGYCGGGGAGGLLAHTSQSLANGTNYSCTVGAGGASYVNGSDSTFQGLTAAVGGGKGGANSSTNPAGNGGSGGGSMGLTSSPFGALAGGTGQSGQGNNGGSGYWGSSYAGGGGGGAGAVGGNSSTTSPSVAGNGGAGVNTYSSWATATTTGVSGFFAGGGGGASNLAGQTGGTAGSGGSGGGGSGTLSTTGNPATANTGSGGGGGQSTGGAGGSGIIIIRYPIA